MISDVYDIVYEIINMKSYVWNYDILVPTFDIIHIRFHRFANMIS